MYFNIELFDNLCLSSCVNLHEYIANHSVKLPLRSVEKSFIDCRTTLENPTPNPALFTMPIK